MVGASLTTERSFYLRPEPAREPALFARLRHAGERAAVQNVENVVEELEIEDIVRQRLDGCSTGMLQQVALARALLGAPRLLLLDEPTRSLDVDAVRRLWSAVERRKHAGAVVATHRAEDLAHCGRRVGLGSSKTRPRAIYALVRRDFAITQSYRVAFYLDIVLGVVDLCIYFFISETFPQATEDLGGAPSYFAFVAVGLAVTIVIGATSTQLAQRVAKSSSPGRWKRSRCSRSVPPNCRWAWPDSRSCSPWCEWLST